MEPGGRRLARIERGLVPEACRLGGDDAIQSAFPAYFGSRAEITAFDGAPQIGGLLAAMEGAPEVADLLDAVWSLEEAGGLGRLATLFCAPGNA